MKINSEIRRIVKAKGMKMHNWCDFQGVSAWRRLHKLEMQEGPPPPADSAAPDSDPEEENDMRHIQRQREDVWKKVVEARKTYVTFNAPPTWSKQALQDVRNFCGAGGRDFASSQGSPADAVAVVRAPAPQ